MKRKLRIGDRVQCVRGYDYRNGRANQTGRIVGVYMAWDDNSGVEDIDPKEFKVIRRKPKRVKTFK